MNGAKKLTMDELKLPQVGTVITFSKPGMEGTVQCRPHVGKKCLFAKGIFQGRKRGKGTFVLKGTSVDGLMKNVCFEVASLDGARTDCRQLE